MLCTTIKVGDGVCGCIRARHWANDVRSGSPPSVLHIVTRGFLTRSQCRSAPSDSDLACFIQCHHWHTTISGLRYICLGSKVKYIDEEHVTALRRPVLAIESIILSDGHIEIKELGAEVVYIISAWLQQREAHNCLSQLQMGVQAQVLFKGQNELPCHQLDIPARLHEYLLSVHGYNVSFSLNVIRWCGWLGFTTLIHELVAVYSHTLLQLNIYKSAVKWIQNLMIYAPCWILQAHTFTMPPCTLYTHSCKL